MSSGTVTGYLIDGRCKEDGANQDRRRRKQLQFRIASDLLSTYQPCLLRESI